MGRTGILAAAVAALAVTSAGSATSIVGFRTPSKNIGCLYFSRSLRCDILSGLKPEPKPPCELDWTGISVPTRGRAAPTCAGDTAYDRRTPILRYGYGWRRGGITCVSKRTGLRCVNRSGHGFFLSRERWRLY